MRILVTGGAGFIGKHILEWLEARGHALHVIDDFSTGRISHVGPNVALTKIDMTALSCDDLTGVLADFHAEAVVHLAAMHFIPDCMARPERTFAVNSGITHTLIEALSRHSVQRLVYASTMDVYSIDDHPHDEQEPPAPANIYGLSKLIGEQIVAYGARRGLYQSACALRLANVYGPDETNPHLIPEIIARLDNPNTPELVMGYLGATRDFVFVREVAEAFGLAVTAAPSGFHCLNVGTGSPVSVREVVTTLQRLCNDSRPVRENPAVFRAFDRASLTPIVDSIRTVLDWRAHRSITQGLVETIEAIHSNLG